MRNGAEVPLGSGGAKAAGLRTLTAAALLVAAAVMASALLAGEAPDAPGAGAPPPPHREGLVVFVLDASASMRIRDAEARGRDVSRLEAAAGEILATLSGLRQEGDFTFDVLVCSRRLEENRIESLSASLGRDGPMALDPGTEEGARQFLAALRPSGVTRLFEALQEALWICGKGSAAGNPGTVFLYTDGIHTGRLPTAGGRGSLPFTAEAFYQGIEAANPGGCPVNAYAVSATSEGIEFLRGLCACSGGILFVP